MQMCCVNKCLAQQEHTHTHTHTHTWYPVCWDVKKSKKGILWKERFLSTKAWGSWQYKLHCCAWYWWIIRNRRLKVMELMLMLQHKWSVCNQINVFATAHAVQKHATSISPFLGTSPYVWHLPSTQLGWMWCNQIYIDVSFAFGHIKKRGCLKLVKSENKLLWSIISTAHYAVNVFIMYSAQCTLCS